MVQRSNYRNKSKSVKTVAARLRDVERFIAQQQVPSLPASPDPARTPTPCQPLPHRLTPWRRSQRAPEMTSFTVASILEKTTNRSARTMPAPPRVDATRPHTCSGQSRLAAPRPFCSLSLASHRSAPHLRLCAGTRTFATWPPPTCSPSSPRRPSSRTRTANARSASACSSCSTTSRLMCRAWPSSGACPARPPAQGASESLAQ